MADLAYEVGSHVSPLGVAILFGAVHPKFAAREFDFSPPQSGEK